MVNVIVEPIYKTQRLDSLKAGEFCIVEEDNSYKGYILYCSKQGQCVALNEPNRTWSEPCGLIVRVLEPGTKITIVI